MSSVSDQSMIVIGIVEATMTELVQNADSFWYRLLVRFCGGARFGRTSHVVSCQDVNKNSHCRCHPEQLAELTIQHWRFSYGECPLILSYRSRERLRQWHVGRKKTALSSDRGSSRRSRTTSFRTDPSRYRVQSLHTTYYQLPETFVFIWSSDLRDVAYNVSYASLSGCWTSTVCYTPCNCFERKCSLTILTNTIQRLGLWLIELEKPEWLIEVHVSRVAIVVVEGDAKLNKQKRLPSLQWLSVSTSEAVMEHVEKDSESGQWGLHDAQQTRKEIVWGLQKGTYAYFQDVQDALVLVVFATRTRSRALSRWTVPRG